MSHLYGVLGIPANADRHQVKSAFRTLAMTCHPDREGGSEARFREISRAYATLADPVRRAAYDARCAQLRAAARRRLAATVGTMMASFMLTVSSGVAVAGWLLAT
jgi:DnaJ-class molecular chaperone